MSTTTVIAAGVDTSSEFAALFEESLSRQDMRSGEVISAEVVRLDHNFVIVNAGLKSEAFIPVEEFKKGDELEAVVLAIDVERERVSLGVKQLEGDPFNNFAALNDKGAIVNGTVKSVEPKGAVIQLNDEVEGYLRASEISRDRVEDAGTHLKVGDAVEALVINIDRKARSIQLSIKAKDNAETQEAMQKMSADSNAASGTTSLGALLKAKLDNKN